MSEAPSTNAAFPRMDHEGKTTLCLATHTVSGPGGAPAAPGEERPLTLGQLMGKLNHGTGTLHTQREDRRNIAKGVRPLTYGPFSSYAPSYDATFASLTKEESHLIYHTLLDVESLRSLSELGVDVEFLSEVEDDIAASQRDYGIAPALRHTADLIQRLYKEQWDRVDVEFLSEVEDDIAASQRDYGIASALRHTANLIQRLYKEQWDRIDFLETHFSNR
ncbi:Bromodomain-containing protein 7 [Operophtera brumata]|uniref:Bromodomain-containing protein 7 n=1 Tax=Operophtera brumata TaxID=104452 RepID=A0A0L7KVD1_OPEBR|nr:Bromodomain-containing protein 7 [Operophtera brumata]